MNALFGFSRFAVFAVVAASVLGACGSDRRGGGNILIARDAGRTEIDSGFAPIDTGVPPNVDSGVITHADAAGFPDASSFPDAGFADAAGFPDAGGEADSGVLNPISATIRDIQDQSAPNHPADITAVRISGVVVTALQTIGQTAGSFWVQEPFGGPFSGILIFVPPARVGVYTVSLGDRLTLSGVYKEYFDVSEIELDAIDTQVPGAELAPAELSPSDIATGGSLSEAYEGVLVRVSNLQVLSDNPDAPMDFGEFTVNGNLRVDDMVYRLTPRPAIGTFLSSITGVHHHAFANYKLCPRTANDIVF